MIFECLLLFFFASFAISSLGVAAFHLSQALGILPVTDLAISLSLRAETVRQMISLTFFCANLAAIGLAACVVFALLRIFNDHRELSEVLRFFGRFNRPVHNHHRIHEFRPIEDIPLPTKLQPFAKHRRTENILTIMDPRRSFA